MILAAVIFMISCPGHGAIKHDGWWSSLEKCQDGGYELVDQPLGDSPNDPGPQEPLKMYLPPEGRRSFTVRKLGLLFQRLHQNRSSAIPVASQRGANPVFDKVTRVADLSGGVQLEMDPYKIQFGWQVVLPDGRAGSITCEPWVYGVKILQDPSGKLTKSDINRFNKLDLIVAVDEFEHELIDSRNIPPLNPPDRKPVDPKKPQGPPEQPVTSPDFPTTF